MNNSRLVGALILFVSQYLMSLAIGADRLFKHLGVIWMRVAFDAEEPPKKW